MVYIGISSACDKIMIVPHKSYFLFENNVFFLLYVR